MSVYDNAAYRLAERGSPEEETERPDVRVLFLHEGSVAFFGTHEEFDTNASPAVTYLTRAQAVTKGPARGGRLQRFFDGLGPGLITGAADDDPSGISTYSVAGAAYGFATLWTALFSFP